uniref:Immunoglobulin superfamily, DCC subclass, member 4 n=1 Tax=Oncorhynchus mykiss TaxID=8022 RepID=A0A8K9XAH1_ONCMY
IKKIHQVSQGPSQTQHISWSLTTPGQSGTTTTPTQHISWSLTTPGQSGTIPNTTHLLVSYYTRSVRDHHHPKHNTSPGLLLHQVSQGPPPFQTQHISWSPTTPGQSGTTTTPTQHISWSLTTPGQSGTIPNTTHLLVSYYTRSVRDHHHPKHNTSPGLLLHQVSQGPPPTQHISWSLTTPGQSGTTPNTTHLLVSYYTRSVRDHHHPNTTHLLVSYYTRSVRDHSKHNTSPGFLLHQVSQGPSQTQHISWSLTTPGQSGTTTTPNTTHLLVSYYTRSVRDHHHPQHNTSPGLLLHQVSQGPPPPLTQHISWSLTTPGQSGTTTTPNTTHLLVSYYTRSVRDHHHPQHNTSPGLLLHQVSQGPPPPQHTTSPGLLLYQVSQGRSQTQHISWSLTTPGQSGTTTTPNTTHLLVSYYTRSVRDHHHPQHNTSPGLLLHQVSQGPFQTQHISWSLTTPGQSGTIPNTTHLLVSYYTRSVRDHPKHNTSPGLLLHQVSQGPPPQTQHISWSPTTPGQSGTTTPNTTHLLVSYYTRSVRDHHHPQHNTSPGLLLYQVSQGPPPPQHTTSPGLLLYQVSQGPPPPQHTTSPGLLLYQVSQGPSQTQHISWSLTTPGQSGTTTTPNTTHLLVSYYTRSVRDHHHPNTPHLLVSYYTRSVRDHHHPNTPHLLVSYYTRSVRDHPKHNTSPGLLLHQVSQCPPPPTQHISWSLTTPGQSGTTTTPNTTHLLVSYYTRSVRDHPKHNTSPGLLLHQLSQGPSQTQHISWSPTTPGQSGTTTPNTTHLLVSYYTRSVRDHHHPQHNTSPGLLLHQVSQGPSQTQLISWSLTTPGQSGTIPNTPHLLVSYYTRSVRDHHPKHNTSPGLLLHQVSQGPPPQTKHISWSPTTPGQSGTTTPNTTHLMVSYYTRYPAHFRGKWKFQIPLSVIFLPEWLNRYSGYEWKEGRASFPICDSFFHYFFLSQTVFCSSAQEILLGALKPYTRYELAVQSNGGDVVGPFSATVEESTLTDIPSTPPAELQLSALDSSSVLVNWRPPVEPNGIIISYRILYTINLSQPEHLWNNLSQDGTIMSAEVAGLSSGTQYFFKMRASTEVGVGPYSPVKDVHTPPRKYELDIHAVTGIIVGVCLGLLSMLLCMCVSFRNGKAREVSEGLDSTALPPQYHHGCRSVPTMVPECSDCHELETLMPLGSLDHEHDCAQPLTEPTEEHSLMGNVGIGDDALGAELMVSSQDTRYHTRNNYKYSTFQDYLLSRVFLLTLSFSRLLGMGQLVVTGPTGSPNTGIPSQRTLQRSTMELWTWTPQRMARATPRTNWTPPCAVVTRWRQRS